MEDPLGKYHAMKEKHQAEVNTFPIYFAFNKEQFSKVMSKLGLAPEDTSKIIAVGDTGGFIRKTDVATFHEMLIRHARELTDAIAADKTGEGFILDMFRYELANHEFSYTGEIDDTLDALGLTPQDFDQNPALRHGLQKACGEQE